ncbi:MAG: CRISPR-associated DxTHG motif protein [Pyrobaculum arsenaticum]|uniref:CRISPR-associated protein DxTHG motif protein n=4 Tax=Pyrobaculum TaxID=2276 RepID=A4WJY1_PYRAR|nr:CRISPR-associated DxTHG motif protein [Pyrobaculum arsenaticum]ABP50698.1 CRISPR-associated protein DxTHG motif protein [Pyrobaculum arsenaticum DSM 13514]MCY0891134.1 CRISPR-associated DxTHG motif protein [Pyrobaculum arsenaticum]
MRRLYVATWGNPLEWREVDYQCDGRGVRRGFASAVCAEADKYVVHVLDSVVTASGGGQGRPLNPHAVEAAKKAGLKVVEKDGAVHVEPPQCEKWREYARRYVEELLRRIGIEGTVVVTAAVGRLSNKTYRGTPDLILSELIWGLWQAVKELGEPKGQLDIHLDVTHGINFMPTAALWAARLVASIALAAGYDKVVLKAYNSTPNQWHYVEVFTEEVTHIQFPRPPRSPAAKALYYGAPIHYAHLCKEEQCHEPPTAEPTCVDNEVHYPQPRTTPLQLYEILLTQAGCPQSIPTLKQLKDWHLVKVLPPTASMVVRHELSAIQKALGRRKIGKCTKLIEILPYAAGDPNPCQDDNRNFVAHAGLLADHTELCPHGDDYQIKIEEATMKCLQK